MTTQENYIRRIQQGVTVPPRTNLQSLVAELCDADRATVTGHFERNINARHMTVADIAAAAQEEYLDRWAEAVFCLFAPYDYQLYRVYAETIDPLLALTCEVQP